MNVTLSQALLIGISGQVLYHVTQKMVAPNAHPILAVITFYVVAIFLCLPLFAFFPLEKSLGASLKAMNWAVPGVAVSIVLIEIGFLLIYRVGGALSTSFVLASAATAVVTMVVGLAVFRESISATKLVGFALCAVGVALLAKSS